MSLFRRGEDRPRERTPEDRARARAEREARRRAQGQPPWGPTDPVPSDHETAAPPDPFPGAFPPPVDELASPGTGDGAEGGGNGGAPQAYDEPAALGEPPEFGEPEGLGEPVAGEPAYEDPALEDPALEDPALEDPALEDPALEDPTLDERALDEPALQEPALEDPALDERALDEPAPQEPPLTDQDGPQTGFLAADAADAAPALEDLPPLAEEPFARDAGAGAADEPLAAEAPPPLEEPPPLGEPLADDGPAVADEELGLVEDDPPPVLDAEPLHLADEEERSVAEVEPLEVEEDPLDDEAARLNDEAALLDDEAALLDDEAALLDDEAAPLAGEPLEPGDEVEEPPQAAGSDPLVDTVSSPAARPEPEEPGYGEALPPLPPRRMLRRGTRPLPPRRTPRTRIDGGKGEPPEPPEREARNGGDGGDRPPRSPRRQLVLRLVAIAALLLAAVAIWFTISLFQPFKQSEGYGQVSVQIPRGADAGTIGDILEERGVVASSFFFALRARLSGSDLQGGTYGMRRDMTYSGALDALEAGPPPVQTTAVTVPEGRSRREEAAKLRTTSLTGSYLTATKRSDVLDPRDYGAPRGVGSLEGFLFPETYEVRPGANVRTLVTKQLREFKRRFREVPMRRARRANLTPYEVLIIASMIERETNVRRERPVIASVIHNRLREGIPLGIDATLRYATNNWGRPLRQSELNADTAYNTRTRQGLPPTPIGSPGLDSIKAAANPRSTDYLFFVVKPGGCHAFSRTDAEFQRDVRRYNEARQAQGGRDPGACS